MKEPQAIEEARNLTYGNWAGNPKGHPYKEGFCAKGVWSVGRCSEESQCCRKNGYGPAGLYCKQHDPEAMKAKQEAKEKQWREEFSRSSERHRRESACIRACAGISDPESAIKAAREALEKLIRHTEINTCRHEETHRGGTIWTICDACGRKWADDMGGFHPYEDPKELTAAYEALAALTPKNR